MKKKKVERLVYSWLLIIDLELQFQVMVTIKSEFAASDRGAPQHARNLIEEARRLQLDYNKVVNCKGRLFKEVDL